MDLESYKKMLKERSIGELMDEREYLIKEIKEYERDKKSGFDLAEQCPDLFMVYVYNHLYLAQVCKLIGNKADEDSFEREIIQGCR